MCRVDYTASGWDNTHSPIMFYPVSGLLEKLDFSNDMCNLESTAMMEVLRNREPRSTYLSKRIPTCD